MCHIIWNVYLIDKEFIKTQPMQEIIKDNNISYVLAILPKNDESDPDNHTRGCLQELGVKHDVMQYEGHDMHIDMDEFQRQCDVIEEYRGKRENVFVFCNNGYQRSIPFLTYYLWKHHNDEIPDIPRAIDVILPQVDKANYTELRNKYIESMNQLFSTDI